MKKVLAFLVLAAAAAAGYWFLARSGEGEQTSYRLVQVDRGDVEAVVTATGKLEPVTTVEVGTQVSGRIAEILADFNDRVTSGQVIARIDKTLLEIAVRQAEASVQRSRATLDDARRELERTRRLRTQGIASEVDLNARQYAYDIAQSAMTSAEISLEQAQRNLEYATIYAPIDGTVIERDVEVGQTVAASLSAPRLFLIAGDLSAMQILAAVDEADIGNIHEGQSVRFVVQAHGDESFPGTVRQVRLQSTTEENVVSYTVVIDVSNPDRRLLPGMTATVDFIVSRANGILRVPNAALRFRPTDEMIAQVRQQAGGQDGPSGGSGSNGSGRRPSDVARLWYVDSSGQLAVAPVRTGVTDGQLTEVRGEALREGLQVIAGVSVGAAGSGGANNPFQGNQQSGRPRPPGAI